MSSKTHPHLFDEYGLSPTEEVFEAEEATHSPLLGPDGKRLRYQSRKLGYVGFFRLREHP